MQTKGRPSQRKKRVEGWVGVYEDRQNNKTLAKLYVAQILSEFHPRVH